MEKWTDKENEGLLRFKTDVDSDEIRIKEIIKQALLKDRRILHLLNNTELEKDVTAEPEDYYGKSIYPCYIIPDIQTKSSNFLCYEVMCNSQVRHNKSLMNINITFYALCHVDTIIEKRTGIPRHDLMGAVLQDIFNYTDIFGSRPMLISNVPSVTDNNYCVRTLTFEQITDNRLVKTRNGVPYVADKGLPLGAE